MTALVPLAADLCPDCSGPAHTTAGAQPALFLHAGYGETRTTVTRWCPCGWTLTAAVASSR